jgi:hypothetical protein
MESSFGVPQYLPGSNIFVLSLVFLTWPEHKSVMIRLENLPSAQTSVQIAETRLVIDLTSHFVREVKSKGDQAGVSTDYPKLPKYRQNMFAHHL